MFVKENVMQILRSLIVVGLCLVMTGCSCHKKAVGNVPVAEVDGSLTDVHYAFDSSNLDDANRAILNSNAAWLKGNNVNVQVEGHCDERGTNEYNMALGARRARASFDFLKSAGVPAARMSTVSYGEELPVDPAHNEGAWAKNRRAHFAVK